MIKREKVPLLVILLLYALAIAAFLFFGVNNGYTRNPSYETLYNEYIVYRIDFPGDTFEAEREFAFKLLESAQVIKRDFAAGTYSITYDPDVFQQYLPKGTRATGVHLNNLSLYINYVSENANKISSFYPINPQTYNPPMLSVTVPSVEYVAIYNHPEFISYDRDDCKDNQTFYPGGTGPAETTSIPS